MKDTWTSSRERHQSRIAVRRHRPKKFDPIVETLRDCSQNVASGNQDLQCRATAAFEKTAGAPNQFERVVRI
jgi:hypothetical protein